MAQEPELHRVYRSLNRPLTILGAHRGLFFLALVMGAATFNFFGSLLAGFLTFLSLYGVARWATLTDPEILRILLNSSKFRSRFDPGKFEPFTVVRIARDKAQPHR